MTPNAAIDDEMPEVPLGQEEKIVAPIDGTFDGSLLDAVPGMGEAIPVGTYHFRLEKYSEGWNEPQKDPGTGLAKNPDEAKFGAQPYFNLQWSCQQEPHTGRSVMEFAGWCTPEVFKAASAGDKAARKIVNGRLYVIKDVLAAAGLKAMGNLDIKAFLADHPEVKLQVGLQEGKTKNNKGEYVKDGSMRNKVLKHVSLTRPA